MEYKLMYVCNTAAGDIAKGRDWYDTMPLGELYKWLAIRLAEIPE